MRNSFFILALSCALCAASCATVKEIPDDLTAAQIIQRGQDAAEAGNYKNAEACYEAALERFGSDSRRYVEARYELGHLYLKWKKWDKAYAALKEIVDMYESSTDGAVSGSYYKLSKIELDKIPEKELPSAAKEPVEARGAEAPDEGE